MVTDEKKQIPVAEGLWTIPSSSPDGKPRLIGSKCPSCGEVVFPRNSTCVNCQYQHTDEIELSRNGKIYSLSTVMLPPPKYYKGPVPYTIGYVEFPEAVRVLTRLLGADPESLRIGMEVELIINKLQDDEEGNEIMGFGFAPVKA